MPTRPTRWEAAKAKAPGFSARLTSWHPTAARCWIESACGPDRAIDLGCGPRGVLELLAERVSPGGQVVGLDADPAHVAMATEFAAGRGLVGVQILTGDARHTGLPSGSFDLVHTRTLLITIPEPAEVVAEMVRLAKPGGWVAAMEFDTEYALCYPPHPAFERLCEVFPVVFGRNGADPWISRRVPELFRDAGLANVEVEVRAAVYPHGHSRRTIRMDLVRSMRSQGPGDGAGQRGRA
jgi:ubiquinone/menaquinone biosynthesis C-methylase UbiE